ncbi:MAG: cytochrome c [Chlorobiaceae bacterium]|jgi:cytochrome c|nr:cytochrome c [Chlorobiaceae bacterium]
MKPYILLVVGVALLFNHSEQAKAGSLDGKTIYNRECSVCHSVNPPPKSAPPLVSLSAQYHRVFKTKAAGVTALAAFLTLPNKKNAVDQEAVSKFGLMPALSLSEAERRSVAEWVWDQYNSNMRMGRGTGSGRGQGRINP